MRDTKHRSEIEKAMKSHLQNDKARTKVGRISQFGLMEMSRQRIRPSIEFGSYIPCTHCGGKGLTPSTETLGLRFLRQLRMETIKKQAGTVVGTVPITVADYLLNNKRKEIFEMEANRELSIRIEGDPGMLPGQHKIVSS